ncbi:ribbon-helix-helix domain-containing protein [Kaistia dalseonensis]|uniref:CopG family transcriptional regulator n=1 Tax=Kaistia dalseonensis TaxID=410840 RepID=A0ABU0HEY2_9HYPH|nr:ribbon-helix-helix domain-containing protein [Kaistia dalseonensis]MCX5497873.1 ribbon-helix-helix domain-containing protein [Kaistia dalseonensis]MDQ0440517.1 hypothetical protein [Kaistia dalseonensis]
MAKRQSLAMFSPKDIAATGGKVVQPEPATTQPSGVKYPKVSVYLEADEVRTLKLLGIDRGQRVSDICATAIREWLERNGHARQNNA